MATRTDPSAARAEQLRTLVTDALSSAIPKDILDKIFSSGEIGGLLVEQLSSVYETMTISERAGAVFPYIDAALDRPIDEYPICTGFPDIAWSMSYDPEMCLYSCRSSFCLEGYDDYRFDIEVTKPELSGLYFVSKLSVCGADIYHKVYSDMAEAFVEEYPVITSEHFPEILSQVQSEVERATNGRYDDTVLEDYWANKAEEEFNSIVELYGLA